MSLTQDGSSNIHPYIPLTEHLRIQICHIHPPGNKSHMVQYRWFLMFRLHRRDIEHQHHLHLREGTLVFFSPRQRPPLPFHLFNNIRYSIARQGQLALRNLPFNIIVHLYQYNNIILSRLHQHLRHRCKELPPVLLFPQQCMLCLWYLRCLYNNPRKYLLERLAPHL